MIHVSHVSKSFGSVHAVQDVSFRAGDGAILGLLGPNGAGKTTTLRAIATSLVPSSGHVTVNGIRTDEHPAQVRATLGVLLDARGLYPRLTARENIAYYGSLHGLSKEAMAIELGVLSDALDMGDIVDRRCEGFSQGERAKVAIARALIHRPSHVILDEPTNGLDVGSTRSLRSFVRMLREQGRCIILSSHIMQEVAALCDDIVVISHGRVVAQGTPDALRNQAGQQDLEEAFVQLVEAGQPS